MSQAMEVKFYREKEQRKALVTAIGEILGCKPVYQRAPSLAYTVGDYTIDRYGTLSFDMQTDEAAVHRLLAELSVRGFEGEGAIYLVVPSNPAPIETQAEENAPAVSLGSLRSVVGEEGLNLTIEVPFIGFSTTALENLDRLVSGKSWLIMKALGADALPIIRTVETIGFPWFPVVSSHLEVDAYARFVFALCELAKKQKRVTLTEKPIDPNASEKFAFRCFLLRLGFIGKDVGIASARKILLSKLSGNGSFKAGDQRNRKLTGDVETAHAGGSVMSGAVSDEEAAKDDEINGNENTVAIPTPLRCQACHHHCYCAEDGLLHTSNGEIVDTSKRAPDKYTHYCLGVPRGFRKLKHAVDWSGGETPPKWCPLATQNNDSVTVNDSAHETTVAHGLLEVEM